MTNPYSTPVSDIQHGDDGIKPKKKWKFLFWLILFLEVISIYSMITDPKETLIDTVLELVFYTMIVIGLFGFSYNKKILDKKAWGVLIPLGIAYDMYVLSKIKFEDAGSTEELYFVIAFTIAFGLPIVFFQYMALYKYSFKSDNIWGKNV